jgi:hypothetical protein
MRYAFTVLLLCCSFVGSAFAHHGVASLGVAGLEGPGSPIETSSSATLPKGRVLVYAKLDYARFELFTPETDGEGDRSAFWMYGIGYGATSYCSLFLFVPFYAKSLEDNSFNTSGFADLSLMGVLGFTYDGGLKRVPSHESLDDMEDWHFTVYGGLTLPTGNENIEDAAGAIDPGMSLGFGKPAYSAGWTATKPFAGRLTFVFDTSLIRFMEHTYNDGNAMRFGDEFRVNSALTMLLMTSAARGFRLDGNIETNYLKLGRDTLNGNGEPATGGDILYVVPGIRSYYKSTSLGIGVKLPVWTGLNETDGQQGAEGTERYRVLVTFSVLL